MFVDGGKKGENANSYIKASASIWTGNFVALHHYAALSG